MKMVDESQLLDAARNGDAEALGHIFDLYAAVLFRYAFRLCHDRVEADRIVGDVFAQLIEHLMRGKGPRTNLRAYLYQITYHVLVEHVRDAGRVTPIEDAWNVPDGRLSVALEVEAREAKRVLEHAMQHKLTAEQRHVIWLRFVEGFSLKEAADITGKTVNGVSVLQNRALSKLRKALNVRAAKAGDYEARGEAAWLPA
jgi:RNA polymerase sigma-70 factor (ECF subfamily)